MTTKKQRYSREKWRALAAQLGFYHAGTPPHIQSLAPPVSSHGGSVRPAKNETSAAPSKSTAQHHTTTPTGSSAQQPQVTNPIFREHGNPQIIKQFQLRIPESMKHKLDFICKLQHISRQLWIRRLMEEALDRALADYEASRSER